MPEPLVHVNAAISSLRACLRGASAVEFALVLPVLLLMLFGTLQVSLLMFSYAVMAGAARDATRAMAVCTFTDTGRAEAQARNNLPAWVNAGDWKFTSSIGDDVSMTISVDPAKASVISFLPLLSGQLTTHVTMRKEPLQSGGGAC